MKLNMQIFGEFSLSSGSTVLSEKTLHSNKLIRLLAYILIHRDTVLTHQRLIQAFWEDNSRSPEGALKNLMYRLRTMLKAFGDVEFIRTLPGAYQWNPEVEVETDYERFEELTARARGVAESQQQVQEDCENAIECYRGNVTSRLIEEQWILPRVTWYRSLYIDTVKRLSAIYEEQGAWVALETLCNQALDVDLFDEDIHCSLIRSLCRQKKVNLAAMHYENTRKLFYENMGVHTPEKLHEVFKDLLATTGDEVQDIETLIEEVKEPEAPDGAFFCDYRVFQDIYRIEARRFDRLGMAEYVMLLTVYRNGRAWRDGVADQGLAEGMEILETLVRGLLRIGDVVARYSASQLILLLPACTYESGLAVARRIQKNFRRKIGRLHLDMRYEMAELDPTE